MCIRDRYTLGAATLIIPRPLLRYVLRIMGHVYRTLRFQGYDGDWQSFLKASTLSLRKLVRVMMMAWGMQESDCLLYTSTRRSPEVAIALKDMWVFLRTPTFALNGVANAIIFPGLMAVWFLAGGGQNPFSSIPEFAAFMAAPEFASFHALVLAAMIMWSAGSNMVGALSLIHI